MVDSESAAEKPVDSEETEEGEEEESSPASRAAQIEEAARPEGTGPDEEEEEDRGWYILQVRGGREDKIKKQLHQKLRSEGLNHLVEEIKVPKEKVSKIKGGERSVHEKKLFPGYIMIRMDLDENARYFMKSVRGVYQFLGDEKPRKLSREEVDQMFAPTEEEEEEPKVDIEFEEGDTVRIKEGPFENMEGNVEEVLPEKGLVRLTVTIFGRATPVELEYWQLEEI